MTVTNSDLSRAMSGKKSSKIKNLAFFIVGIRVVFYIAEFLFQQDYNKHFSYGK